MNQIEYLKYMKEVNQAHDHVRRFKNYSISPWVVNKYGFEAVKQDFEMRFGKEFHVRMAVRKEPNSVTGSGWSKYIKNVYYILEKRKGKENEID